MTSSRRPVCDDRAARARAALARMIKRSKASERLAVSYDADNVEAYITRLERQLAEARQALEVVEFGRAAV